MTFRLLQTGPIVYVVDDDIPVLASLELLFRSAGLKVQPLASAQAFLSHLRLNGPGCLVLDVSLPDLNGLDLQERIAAEGSQMPIIFITGHGNIPMTVKAMKAGAGEFLAKPFNGDTILGAVRNAIEFSTATVDSRAERDALSSCFSSLTPRERAVMELVVLGLLNKQVGNLLGISEITVNAHRGRMMQKMRAQSLADVVRIATKLHLPSPPLELGTLSLGVTRIAARQAAPCR